MTNQIEAVNMQVVKNEKRPTPDKIEEQLWQFIEKFSLEQLYEINGIIIDRIKYLEKIKDLQEANAFRRGNKVSWERDGTAYSGVVVKINQKTINVAEDKPPYRQWKISPQYLKIIKK